MTIENLGRWQRKYLTRLWLLHLHRPSMRQKSRIQLLSILICVFGIAAGIHAVAAERGRTIIWLLGFVQEWPYQVHTDYSSLHIDGRWFK